MIRRPAIALIASAALVGCIVAANYVTSRYGMVPVGFGLVATAGTYFAGVTFVLRDAVQDLSRPHDTAVVVALILIGAGASYALSTPALALASGAAFLGSEAADFAVYTPLRDRGYIRAAVASNIVGALLDTLLFLSIAGFPLTGSSVSGQLLAKLAITLAVVLAVAASRRRA